MNAPFPDSTDKDVLYVKLSWDSKTFRVVNSTLIESPASSPSPHLKPSPPMSPPCSLSAATPKGPQRQALPTPDPTVMQRASLGDVRGRRATTSAGKAAGVEAESLHSASKLSASKCLSAKIRNVVSRTPGVCKRLDLSGECCTRPLKHTRRTGEQFDSKNVGTLCKMCNADFIHHGTQKTYEMFNLRKLLF